MVRHSAITRSSPRATARSEMQVTPVSSGARAPAGMTGIHGPLQTVAAGRIGENARSRVRLIPSLRSPNQDTAPPPLFPRIAPPRRSPPLPPMWGSHGRETRSKAFVQLNAAGYSGGGRGVVDRHRVPDHRRRFLGQVPGAVFEDTSTHYPASGEVVPRFADVTPVRFAGRGSRRLRTTNKWQSGGDTAQVHCPLSGPRL
jgi:hypothetical protein